MSNPSLAARAWINFPLTLTLHHAHMITIIEQPRPLPPNSVIELGDNFTDPAIRKLFSRHENTMAMANRSFSDVVLDPITTIVLRDRTAIHCGGHRFRGEFEASIGRLENHPPNELLRDRRVFMGYSKFKNYYHWITECMPAIASYQMDPDFANGVLLLIADGAVTHDMMQAIRLATCGGRLPDLFQVRRDQLPMRELVFSDFLLPQAAPSHFANEVFDRMAAQVSTKKRLPHRRLYVSRIDSLQRPVINEEALIALMVSYGIEPIVPGRLSQIEQISAFRDASLVIGAHGAGLTNIAFMRSGGLVYELFPSYLVRPYFNVMCQGRGIHYLADVFSATGPDAPTYSEQRNLPWQIDLGVVERRLAAIGGNFDHP